MAKFHFKLESILRLKHQMEDNLKNELGKAKRKLDREERILGRLKSEEEECIRDFNAKTSQKTTAKKLKEHNTYISVIRKRIELQKENVNQARLNVDKVRGELIKIVQEREMLEKLKEKKYAEFIKERNKEEQKLNDEVVSYKQSSRYTGEEHG